MVEYEIAEIRESAKSVSDNWYSLSVFYSLRSYLPRERMCSLAALAEKVAAETS